MLFRLKSPCLHDNFHVTIASSTQRLRRKYMTPDLLVTCQALMKTPRNHIMTATTGVQVEQSRGKPRRVCSILQMFTTTLPIHSRYAGHDQFRIIRLLQLTVCMFSPNKRQAVPVHTIIEPMVKNAHLAYSNAPESNDAYEYQVRKSAVYNRAF